MYDYRNDKNLLTAENADIISRLKGKSADNHGNSPYCPAFFATSPVSHYSHKNDTTFSLSKQL